VHQLVIKEGSVLLMHGVTMNLNSFLNSVLHGDDCSVSCPSSFNLRVGTASSFNRRVAEPQRLYGRFGEKENPVPLRGIESPFLGVLTRSLVTTPTTTSYRGGLFDKPFFLRHTP